MINKETFIPKKIALSEKEALVDLGMDLSASKPLLDDTGKVFFELIPTGKIGLLAIIDIRNSIIHISPTTSVPEFISLNNFGEQFDPYFAEKAIGVAIGSQSSIAGLLATSYFGRQKKEFVVEKLALSFKDSDKNKVDEIVFIDNYHTWELKELETIWHREFDLGLYKIKDFWEEQLNSLNVEQATCSTILNTDAYRDNTYNNVRDYLRGVRTSLITLGMNPKDPYTAL